MMTCDFEQDRDTGIHGRKGCAICDMHLHARAQLTLKLGKRRCKPSRSEVGSGQVALVETIGKPVCIDEGRANQFERLCCAAPLRQVRAFDQARTGIDDIPWRMGIG